MFIRVNFENKAWLKRKAVPLTLTRCNSHQFQIALQNNIRIKKFHILNSSEKILLLNWKENSNLKSISTKSYNNVISLNNSSYHICKKNFDCFIFPVFHKVFEA